MIYNYYGVNMIKKDYLEKISTYIILAIIIGLSLLKLTGYFLYFNNFIDRISDFKIVYLLWIAGFILFIVYTIGIISEKYKFNIIDIAMIVLIIFAILGTVFAFKKRVAIFGEIYRYEGLLSILSYYFIFLNIKNISNIKYKKLIINTFLIVSAFQVFYAFLQVFTNFNFIKHYSKHYMATAFCGNPNFFGSYVVMPLMISLVTYLTTKKNNYLILTIYYFIGLCLANSTGPFLSFIVAFIFLIIVFYKRTTIKKIIITTLVLILTFFTMDYSIKYVNTNLLKQTTIDRNYNIKDELQDTFSNKTGDRIANGRLIVWKRSLPLVRRYWLVGAGLDNFAYVYPQNGLVMFDKAHNVYIQMSVTNGVFVLIIYCLICLYVFIKNIKLRDPFYIGLYMTFVVYSIQAFGNINVIEVTPIFYAILALLYSKNNGAITELDK